MRPLVVSVTGGKGGTGKTVVVANLALTAARAGLKTLLVDLDVENPCAHTPLGAELKVVREVEAFRPIVDEERCTLCGACTAACPAHALILGRKLLFLETLCEGCAACVYVCPTGAIKRGRTAIGWVKRGSGMGVDLVAGELRPGSRQYHEVLEETLRYV